MVFPEAQFYTIPILAATGATLSDILLLAIKDNAGKLRENEGGQPVNTTGDLATLTAAAGKDMYLGEAHANVALEDRTGHFGTGTIELKVNGVTKETWNFTLNITPGEGSTGMDSHEFLIGFKVTTGQIIKLECTSAGTNVLTEGSIVCWEEDTGTNPGTEFGIT